MSEEIVVQVSHLKNVVDIWKEAKRLFAGQTVTDFTLTITSLITTKYVDGEDIPAHIAKMKGFQCDLTLMGKDLDDGLFGCFLRISMPPTWNYVFASLPNDYTSAEVERRIKDEYGTKVNQETLATAYQAGQRQGRAKPGNVVCENCKCPGHSKAKCWLPGGGAEGKGPNHKKKKKKQSEKQKEDEKKLKHRANQAISDESDSEEEAFMVTTPVHHHSCFHWILDGGATTHICTDQNLFIMFTEKQSYIGGIQKNTPSLISNGSGDIRLTCNIDGDTECTITLMDVAFCPDAHDNLISESHMDQKGLEIRKWNGQVRILHKNGSVLMQGCLQRNLYELDCYTTPHTSQSNFAFAAKYTQSLDLWHRRLAHISGDALKYMAKHNLVTGMDLSTNGDLGPCDGCAKGKHPQAPFPKKSQSRADKILQ